MALFDESASVLPVPRTRMRRRTAVGMWALVVALVVLVVLTFLPTAYVIQQPGPVYNTIGVATTADGEELPLIAIDGARTYETAGHLDLLTVQVVGNRERTPSWFELATAWLDPSRSVVPIDAVYPEGVTTEDREEQNAALMVDSQAEATAAALIELDHDVNSRIEVVSVVEGSPADGVLREGDRIVAVDGDDVAEAAGVSERIQQTADAPVTLTVVRDGDEQEVTITPELDTAGGAERWLVGVSLTTDFTFPFDVEIQLDNVGGPSAGMMFALGIIDELTPGELNGGAHIAGTGTIDATGDVGPIGGIRQKLYGARDAGAEYFLAPADNCGEVVGHVPDGIRVFKTATLSESRDILDTIADEGDLDTLPSCMTEEAG